MKNGIIAFGCAVLALVIAAGSVAAEERPGFSITSLGSATSVWSTSLAIGANGLGIVSYIKDNYLYVGRCRNIGCTQWHASSVDYVNFNAQRTSIAIGSDRLPIISYGSGGNVLKLRHCSDLDCATGTTQTIGSSSSTDHNSIAIGSDGMPIFVYGNVGFMLVVHCKDAECKSADQTLINNTNGGDSYKSMAIGVDGLPVIAYFDNGNHLRVVHCSDVKCATSTIRTLDDTTDAGYWLSMTIGVDGRPLISYQRNKWLAVAHCINIDCGGTGDTITPIFYADNNQATTSITIGPDGLGIVSSYSDVSTDRGLKVTHCENVLCSRSSSITVESGFLSAGRYSSIVIGADGWPLISYFNGAVKVAHLSNNLGTPNVRRR